MIEITLNQSNKQITITGHSNKNELDYEAVCSSVSTSSQFLTNLYNYNYTDDKNELKLYDVDFNKNGVKVFIKLMTELSQYYPNHVKIITRR